MADADDKKKTKEELKAEKQAAKEAKKAEKQAAKEAKKADGDDSKETKETAAASSGGIVQWIIMAVVIILFAAIGFAAGKLLIASGPTTATAMQTEANQPQEQQNTEEYIQEDDDFEIDSESKTWFYPLEPVTTNLDELGAMRFVRATLTLEISSELSSEEGSVIIEEKKPVLTDWLTIYLGSLTIEDTSGGRNKKRIQSQILDAFNEMLFPDSKPKIKKILLMEFAIQ